MLANLQNELFGAAQEGGMKQSHFILRATEMTEAAIREQEKRKKIAGKGQDTLKTDVTLRLLETFADIRT
jgi:hypothetical protein